MKFNTDSHFVIGRDHVRQNKPCQDHALDISQDSGKTGIAVLSDGCSSGHHTDIGARVITCSTIAALKFGCEPELKETPNYIKWAITDKLIDSKSTLSITNEDLLATCSYAYMQKEGGLIHLTGDGAVAIKYKNGDIDIAVVDWQNNTPFYLVYNLHNYAEFIELHKSIEGGTNTVKVVTTTLSDLEETLHTTNYTRNLNEAMAGYILRITTTEHIECIAIFSDGIQDFRRNDTEVIPVEKTVYEMMNFKNYTGEFVKRRVTAALKKYAKEDIHPGDDFSMAVIHFDHKTTESL